jgi:hypothetical protein
MNDDPLKFHYSLLDLLAKWLIWHFNSEAVGIVENTEMVSVLMHGSNCSEVIEKSLYCGH